MKRCEQCGDREATQVDADGQGYCDACVARMEAGDDGAVHHAASVIGHSLEALTTLLRDQSEVRRVVAEIVEQVFSGEPGDAHVDMPAYKAAQRFRPVDREPVTA